MTRQLGNLSSWNASLWHNAELADYGFLATFFICNDMHAICVLLIENKFSFIQSSNVLVNVGTVPDILSHILDARPPTWPNA